MEVIINRCYNKSTDTKNKIVDFGFILFTKEFKYLGSVVSYDLDNYADIIFRITRASQSMGALKYFYNSDHVDISAKGHIYLVIPGNLLL